MILTDIKQAFMGRYHYLYHARYVVQYARPIGQMAW
jgi:hypothetical protein